LYKSITEDIQEPVTAEDGIRVMKIIEAAQHSSKEKRVIDIK
jgi:predicted dehydrogenase